MQCQNFERGDSSAASASNSVVPSIQLSPTRNPPKSPELAPQREEEVKENNTSPYFKKSNFQQVQREISSKTVVRTIDLGSLSSKLSRKSHKKPERTRTEDKHSPTYPDKEKDPSEALSSSQKENLVQTLEDKGDSVAIIDLTTTSADNPAAHRSCLEKASEPETIRKLVTPKLLFSSSKLTKRKKETTSTGRLSNLRKKAKYEGSSRETETVSSSEGTVETTDIDQHKTEAPSTSTCDPLLSSEETAASINCGLLAESGVEKTNSDQAVESSPPQRLPYYLRNFQTVLQAVLENEDDRELFNQDDMSLVHAFEKLSGILKYHSVIVILKNL